MATTPNYSFSVYSSTDTDVRFLDFRVATAGSQSTSNFYVIDTVLKQHSDAIDSINATPSAFVVKGTYSSGSLYTASVANYPGYKNEQLIVLSLNQKNTGAVQININGTTNKDVMKYGSDGVLKAVDAGDFVANSPVLCLYDGTRFVVIGITSASSITVTGEAGDILQIADDGTIESSGKKTAQPNGIATLDENGNVVQVANMANSAAAVYSGEPVTVEYAGAQRIAAITAYGETPQGGTVKAPVALTGISSVTVNDDVTELPIPRPLHKVGDVMDVCRTRVKSVYDKRIVLDGTEDWKMGSAVGDGAPYIVCDLLNDHYQSDPIVSSRIPYTSISASNKNQGIGGWNRSLYLRYDSLFTNVEELKTYLSAHPLTVYYQSTAYDGANGLDVCLMKYQTGFVELDGTENWQWNSNTAWPYIATFLPNNKTGVAPVCSHYQGTGAVVPAASQVAINELGSLIIKDPSWQSVEDAKAYLAAQKAAGTPVQVAYQLATPEVYATDPVDFDNTAGPLTVVTGGQVEVKMTDFVTDRTPAFLNKLDKTGDGSDVTVTFTEAATDTDIASGDKLSILFGKILKRFTNILNGTTKVGYATKADTDNLGNQITETYANSLDVADNTIVLKNKIGENLSTITVPYANSAGNVATSIKEMGIAVQTASPYAWFLNYTGSGNKDGARKYYASVYADNATYSTSAGSSNNIVIYNNNWSGTDGFISAIYANAEKTYVNLSSSNAAGTAWPNISVQRINGHALNMALNGTSLSITW